MKEMWGLRSRGAKDWVIAWSLNVPIYMRALIKSACHHRNNDAVSPLVIVVL